MKLRLVLILSATVATLAAAPTVHSDTMLSAHAGAALGGDLDSSPATYGGALTFIGDGAFGFEIEGAYTPDFFAGEDQGIVFDEDNVTSLMANILLGTGGERGKVFLTVGAGILKTRARDLDEFFDVDNTDFAASAGIGGIGFFADNLGVRGDVRYYRNLGDPEPDNEFDIDFGEFSFWRATGGLVLRF
jgi:hypothetical protein